MKKHFTSLLSDFGIRHSDFSARFTDLTQLTQLTQLTELTHALPNPDSAPGQLEAWLIPAAAIASMALLFKKLFPRKRSEVGRAGGSPQGPCAPPPDFITRAELHHELNAIRDKIDSRFLALSEKIEAVGISIHDRLNDLQAGLARVDERTKISSSSSSSSSSS